MCGSARAKELRRGELAKLGARRPACGGGKGGNGVRGTQRTAAGRARRLAFWRSHGIRRSEKKRVAYLSLFFRVFSAILYIFLSSKSDTQEIKRLHRRQPWYCTLRAHGAARTDCGGRQFPEQAATARYRRRIVCIAGCRLHTVQHLEDCYYVVLPESWRREKTS